MVGDKANRISVGVGAVIFRGAEVLLIKRGKAPFSGAWSIPGGGLEFGESVETAILREIREETGVEARLAGFLGVYEFLPQAAPGDGHGRHIVIIDHWGEWVSGEPCAGDDAADAGFFPIEKALAMTSWDETRAAIVKASDLRDAKRVTGAPEFR